MRSFLVLVVFSCLILEGCATAPKKPDLRAEAAKEAFVIQQVGISPKTFWPKKGVGLEIRWTQRRKAKTTVEIRKESGELVKRFEKTFSKGPQVVVWDGTNGSGETVDPGIYLYSLRSEDESGHEAIYDPSLITGGEELKVERFTFDRDKRELHFILPRAARTRLRIGLSPFMHLRTLLNWEPLEAGAHTLTWDGLDASGWIRAVDHPGVTMNLAAFALPDNAILVKGDRKETFSPDSPSKLKGSYFHAAHDRADCRDVSLTVDFPNARRNSEGLPILGENTLVRVWLNEEDKSFMINQRYEVMFFVDTVFLFEEEDGQNPFNFEWDASHLAPGEHLLTVNLIGYDDHLGVKTARVVKE